MNDAPKHTREWQDQLEDDLLAAGDDQVKVLRRHGNFNVTIKTHSTAGHLMLAAADEIERLNGIIDESENRLMELIMEVVEMNNKTKDDTPTLTSI